MLDVEVRLTRAAALRQLRDEHRIVELSDFRRDFSRAAAQLGRFVRLSSMVASCRCWPRRGSCALAFNFLEFALCFGWQRRYRRLLICTRAEERLLAGHVRPGLVGGG